MAKPTASFAPIVVFAFNRPQSLARLLTSLQQCPEFLKSPLILRIDGPRTATEATLVNETLAVAEDLKHPHKSIVAQPKNQGLAASVAQGVTAACQAHGRCIVLEDDLTVSPLTLTYFNEALQTYENAPRVMTVEAYAFNHPHFAKVKEALVLPFCHPWGWATWQRAWENFDLNQSYDERTLASHHFRHIFNAIGLDNIAMLSLTRRKLISSWYVRYLYHMVQRGGVSIYPPQPMVENHGIAGGTHASWFNLRRWLTHKVPLATRLPHLPEADHTDYWAVDLIANSPENRVQRYIHWAGSVKRRLKRLIKG